MNKYYVYITSNPSRSVYYIGVTSDLRKRLDEHFQNRGINSSFAGKYYCYKLIYYESFNSIKDAIEREKELKDMKRADKETLIKSINPRMAELMDY